MTIRTSPWPAGVPCWADLMAPDVPAVQRFYAKVLGWTFDEPAAEFGGYTIARANGAAAAGIGPSMPGAREAWTLYIATDDADGTAAAVTANSGTLAMPPSDVGPLGRMFVATDPTGAVFGVWQGGQHIGAGITNEPGGLVWEDLRTPQPADARTFYGEVFGYRFDPVPMAPDDYRTFALADARPLGGMGGMMDDAIGRPHWVVYFGVTDTDAAAEAARQGGGAVAGDPFDSPFGRMAFLTDPAGAAFTIVQTTGDEG